MITSAIFIILLSSTPSRGMVNSSYPLTQSIKAFSLSFMLGRMGLFFNSSRFDTRINLNVSMNSGVTVLLDYVS